MFKSHKKVNGNNEYKERFYHDGSVYLDTKEEKEERAKYETNYKGFTHSTRGYECY